MMSTIRFAAMVKKAAITVAPRITPLGRLSRSMSGSRTAPRKSPRVLTKACSSYLPAPSASGPDPGRSGCAPHGAPVHL
jgi:hypothetical protein